MDELAIVESKTECVGDLKSKLRCSGCGVTIDAGFGCGVGYVPAGVAAAKAVKANPEKSIAKDTGLSEPSGTSKDVTAKRTGRDCKSYPATKPKPKAQPLDIASSALVKIERLVDDMALAVGDVGPDIFKSRIRVVVDQLLNLIRDHN